MSNKPDLTKETTAFQDALNGSNVFLAQQEHTSNKCHVSTDDSEDYLKKAIKAAQKFNEYLGNESFDN